MISAFLKKYFKQILLFLISIFFLLSNTYAESTTIDKAGAVFTDFFMGIVNLIGAIWMIFPIIAGKLMTNDLLYGTSLNFDVILWQIWNFSRAFANFIIGFMFIYFIFKYIISFSGKDISVIKTNLPKVAIASLVVNMSWFLLAILIDLSTILIAGFGSLPAALGNDFTKTDLAIPKTILVSENKCTDKTDNSCKDGMLNFNTKEQQKIDLKQLQGYETAIAGPLLFLGNSILGINTSIPKLLNESYDTDTHKLKKGGPAIKALIELTIFILFIVPMIILIIVNIVRIFWIWIYIAFSPLIFLDQIFGGKAGTKQKALALKNMIGLIFQPALVVLAFSISSVFLIGIADSLIKTKKDGENNKYEESVKKTFMLGDSTNGLAKIEFGNMQDNGKNTIQYVGGFMGYLIMSILIIIILWSMIKLSFSATEVTKGISDSMFKFAEDITKTIPIKTPFGNVSYGSLGYLGQKIESIPGGMVSKQSEKIAKLLNQKHDISLNDIKKYKQISDNGLDRTKKELLSEALDKLVGYRGEVYIKTNTKELLKIIENKIGSSNFTSSLIKSEFGKIKKEEDKIDYIAKNINEIKKGFGINNE